MTLNTLAIGCSRGTGKQLDRIYLFTCMRSGGASTIFGVATPVEAQF